MELEPGLIQASHKLARIYTTYLSMPSTTKTIVAVSQPRQSFPVTDPKPPPMYAERKDKKAESVKAQEAMDQAVGEWFSMTQAKAVELGKRFDKRPRYFLDRFFQGGAHMVNHHEKPNAYNAFKAEKAAERREEGSKGMTAPELHAAYHAEYDNMTDEEKAALAQRHQEQREEIPKIRRDTPQGRMRDMSNVVHNIQLLMIGLMYRVGIEGFFCIVRNSSDFFMPPQWYFTSQEVERYMPLAVGRKWDTGSVGTKIEAFAVAGCDTLNLLRTNGQCVAWVKAEIRDMVLSGLVEVSKKQLKMEYVHYREDIVVKHGLELIRWTADKFVSPSELSSSLHVLGKLRDALKEGTCKWVKLSPAEHQARKDAWKADVADGKVVPKARNPRSDIGTKRKRSDDDNDADTDADEVHDSGNEERNDDAQPASPIIEEPDDGADAAASTTPTAPPPKRRKTNAASAPAAAKKSAAKKPAAAAKQPCANKENQGTGCGGLKRAGKDPKDNADAATKRARLAVRDARQGPKAVPKLRTRRGVTSPALIPDDAGAEAQGSSGTAEVAPVATPMVTTIPFAIDPALLAV
ncbi:hypothetical protein B0H10DRAFT_2322439 [Mycena sp. CBHHK59/15]|nr:hypothetical protein B0H10DRAFT_2322439 [Mycena sp. CBHHK59/15]